VGRLGNRSRDAGKGYWDRPGGLEGQTLTAGSLDGQSVFCLEHTVHNETTLCGLFARTFTSEDIDRVKRNLGQVKDLTRSASVYQKELLALHELRRQGNSNFEIGQMLGYSRKAICRALKRAANHELA
jgi:hypothetical protein